MNNVLLKCICAMFRLLITALAGRRSDRIFYGYFQRIDQRPATNACILKNDKKKKRKSNS